jgi:hypothetical protein
MCLLHSCGWAPKEARLDEGGYAKYLSLTVTHAALGRRGMPCVSLLVRMGKYMKDFIIVQVVRYESVFMWGNEHSTYYLADGIGS